MGKFLTGFKPVDGLDDIYTAEKSGMRCTAIRLASGDLCLYSPVLGLNDLALSSLNGLGEVTHLLAPNHYHHRGLKEYADAFPFAKLCATAFAISRLEKQTDLIFEGLDELGAALQPYMRFLLPDGLKTGEVWIGIKGLGQNCWIVTDAFSGSNLSPGMVCEQPNLLGTFPGFGIANRNQYRDWLAHEIAVAPPKTIIPCHGAIIAGEHIASRALELIENLS